MQKTKFGERFDESRGLLGYVETDPSGRYGRFREILGKGAMKIVYKAFDEVLGMEVAWNQVQLSDVFHSPQRLQHLYSEVHLLKDLDHETIMHFHTSWIDIDRRTFNFITEMFTSGTLREYRKKYLRVDIRAIKNWARQILRGLAYLHSHDPPIIHRDLKCDNIFVNGHLGQIKIGDLGLAAILHGLQHACSVIGTPEFMAPELYDEEYNELVDVYSFGMCVIEMLTSEYPYSECSNPAQIYKKVTSGKLPDAFYRIRDGEAQKFVKKCVREVSKRSSAEELLMDPFLASDTDGKLLPIPGVPSKMSILHGTPEEVEVLDADQTKDTDMNMTGTINAEDDTVFLRIQIHPRDGNIRNVYFPFDIVNDTPVDVAVEMVKELEISDWEPLDIAKMIEETIASLLPARNEFDHRHNFNYEEDFVEAMSQPFYSSFSHSSQASFRALNSSPENQFPCWRNMICGESISKECLSDDGTRSKCSLNSFQYSDTDYISGNEENCSSSLIPVCNAENNSSTRFCPKVSTSTDCHRQPNLLLTSCRCCSSHDLQKLSRNRSLVDLRSQLLHRSLLEELSKRRLFKTVGTLEDIGYQEPGKFFGKVSLGGGTYASGDVPQSRE